MANRWGLIVDGKVREVVYEDPAGRFHPELVFVALPDGVGERHTYDGQAFGDPARDLDPSDADALATRAARDPAIKAIVKYMAQKEGRTAAALVADLRALV